MRALGAVLVVALTTVGGCVPNDTGAVLLHLDQRSDASLLLPTYSSSTAAVSFSPDGPVHFTATSSQGLVTLLLPGPLISGSTVELPTDEERVHFAVGNAGWGNQGGNIFIISVNPAIVRFAGVPMVARSGAAFGSFVFDGDGTFR